MNAFYLSIQCDCILPCHWNPQNRVLSGFRSGVGNRGFDVQKRGVGDSAGEESGGSAVWAVSLLLVVLKGLKNVHV